MVGKVVSHVALEAMEGGAGEDQDVSRTVHPAVDLDEEIRMSSLAAEETGEDLNSSFVLA
jgi:hypothetical protein